MWWLIAGLCVRSRERDRARTHRSQGRPAHRALRTERVKSSVPPPTTGRPASTFNDAVPVPVTDPATPTPHVLITIAQAAAQFHRTPRTLRNWRKRGWLQAVRVCGGLYFREADIKALCTGKAVSAAELDAAPSEAAAPDTTALNTAPRVRRHRFRPLFPIPLQSHFELVSNQ